MARSKKTRPIALPGTPPGATRRAVKAASPAAEADPTTTMTLRVRRRTAKAIAAAAKTQGLTMKQVICTALRQAGVDIAEVDLQDRTPRRQP